MIRQKRCPKCGATKATITFHEEDMRPECRCDKVKTETLVGPSVGPWDRSATRDYNSEHLSNQCIRCRYAWATKVDKPKR